MQYFCRLVTTFSRFTGALAARGGNRNKMIGFIAQITGVLFVYNERQEMKKQLIAGLLAAAVLGGITAIPANAACRGATHCYGTVTKTSYTVRASSPHRAVVKRALVRGAAVHRAPVHTASTHRLAKSSRVAALSTRKRVHVASGAAKPRSLNRSYSSTAALAVPASNAAQGHVISLIQAMAPAQGVPTWFALRIARVESNYNPRMRGAAGEYGVFQMKCATAKGIGFSGNCAALLDPRTNIHWGLRHLALAIGASDGNLRLAASKHNGGLGRRTVVASYVNKVF